MLFYCSFYTIKNHLLYNGCRNGNIEIIDLQNLKLNTHKNFVKHKSSLCDIQQINSSLFISNSMDGGVINFLNIIIK